MDDRSARAIERAVAPKAPGLHVEVLEEIDSTNSELMRRAREGRAEPVLLVARHQTAGRGRQGRPWDSSAGASLTFSLGMPLAPVDWSGLSLAVGTALAENIDARVRLKWPNDLWLDERKLGGILVETASLPGEERRFLIVGVGLNVAQRSSDGLSVAPAWLHEIDPQVDAARALQRLTPPLVDAVLAFEAMGFAPFRLRFEARDVLRDRPVRLSDGTAGTAHGVTEAGALLVHTAAGMRTITSAEVSVRPDR